MKSLRVGFRRSTTKSRGPTSPRLFCSQKVYSILAPPFHSSIFLRTIVVQPEISEFSYGFALTNELVGWTSLRAAPIFPSLIEEGRSGGGYDVKLDLPGIPMYLQFKRSEYMKTRNAKEFKSGAPLTVPYYRFHLMEAAKSDQHQLLLQLDDGSNEVYYAAPRFHKLAQINSAWNSNTVTPQSIFVAPQAIGRLGRGSHAIAYNKRRAYLCSDPKPVDFFDGDGLRRHLTQKLDQEKHPLRTRLWTLIEHARKAAQSAHDEEEEDLEGAHLRAAPVIETRVPRGLTPPEVQLRELSDIAAKVFGAQLVILQFASEE